MQANETLRNDPALKAEVSANLLKKAELVLPFTLWRNPWRILKNFGTGPRTISTWAIKPLSASRSKG